MYGSPRKHGLELFLVGLLEKESCVCFVLVVDYYIEESSSMRIPITRKIQPGIRYVCVLLVMVIERESNPIRVRYVAEYIRNRYVPWCTTSICFVGDGYQTKIEFDAILSVNEASKSIRFRCAR